MITLPHSTCKKLLIDESGLRANPDAIRKFNSKIIEFAKAEAITIRDKLTGQKRKTIMTEDID